MEVVWSQFPKNVRVLPKVPGHGVVIHGTFWNGFLVQEWILVCLNICGSHEKNPMGFQQLETRGWIFLDDAGSQLLEAQHIHIMYTWNPYKGPTPKRQD